MEKNLSYGDCFNFFGLVFGYLVEDELKNIDKETKKQRRGQIIHDREYEERLPLGCR